MADTTAAREDFKLNELKPGDAFYKLWALEEAEYFYHTVQTIFFMIWQACGQHKLCNNSTRLTKS